MVKQNHSSRYNCEELLLICARGALNEDLRQKALELIKKHVDWECFIKLAIESGAYVLVYNALIELDSRFRLPPGFSGGGNDKGNIPPFVLEKLRSCYIYIIPETTLAYRETLALLKLFKGENIPVIPLKGVLLSKQLYGDIAARGLGVDLDLLIEEKNKERAKSLLQKNGYAFHSNEIDRWQWECGCSKPGHMPVDLHWDITMMVRGPERIEGLWKGTALIEEGDVSYYRLKNEELLLYLSAHMVNSSCFRHLKYVCDINELLGRYQKELDWGHVINEAREWKLSSSLYAALKASKIFFNTDIPVWVVQKIKPSFPKALFIKVFTGKKIVFGGGLRRKIIDGFLSYVLFESIEARSAKEYITILKRIFFPPPEAMGRHRNYFLRIFSGLKRFIRLIRC